MRTNPFPRMHVSLYVGDLQRTIEFYNTFFGTQPVKVKDRYVKYVLEEPSLIISFIEHPERVQSKFGHMGFQVETEQLLDQRMAEMQKAGLISKVEEGVSCCYAKQDKFWVNDPDGVQWEVYYFHEDAEFNDPKYADTSAEACCMPEAAPKERELAAAEGTCCTPGSGCC